MGESKMEKGGPQSFHGKPVGGELRPPRAN